MAPVLEQIAADYKGRVNVVHVNVDSSPDTAGNLGIMSIPATLFFKDGKEVGRLVGAGRKDRFAAEIQKLFGIAA